MTKSEIEPDRGKSELRIEVLQAIIWSGSFKFVGQLFSWLITILVIRLLSPEDYGLLAISNLCINLLVLVGELGMGAAIVQKNDVKEDELPYILGFVLISYGLLAILTYSGAPLIAMIFNEPKVIPIFKVSSVIPIILSFYVIPQSFLLRDMLFKKKALIDFTSILSTSICSLVLALLNFGVWALVISSIVYHIILLLGYHISSRSVFIPKFSFTKVKSFAIFGGHLTLSRLLWYFYSKADTFFIGRFLGSYDLGVYSTAITISSTPQDKILPIINQIAFPAYSKIKDDFNSVRANFLKSSRMVSAMLFPSFWGLGLCSKSLIPLLLGEKWQAAIIPTQLLCVILPIRALSTLNAPLLNGIGKPNISLKNLVIACIIMPISFYIGVRYSLKAVCIGWILGFIVVFFENLFTTLKEIELNFKNYIIDILHPILGSLLMVIIIVSLNKIIDINLSDLVELIVTIILGALIYLFYNYLFNRKLVNEFIDLFKTRIK